MCAKLHGHSYRLDVTVAGTLRGEGSASGMVMDFGELSAVVKQLVVEQLDHTHLNETIENPTCERIIKWIWGQLRDALDGLDELTLWETSTARATLRRTDREALT